MTFFFNFQKHYKKTGHNRADMLPFVPLYKPLIVSALISMRLIPPSPHLASHPLVDSHRYCVSTILNMSLCSVVSIPAVSKLFD